MDGTVLVADDDRTIRTVLTQALTRAGCKVHATSSLPTLMRWVVEGKGDAIITDVMMPEKNGLELLKDIRSDDNMKDLPVILTMLEPFDEIISDGKKLRMNEYLLKPFDIFTLSKILDNVIKTTSGESL